MSTLILDPQQLLWHSRGRHWGHEFLCLPGGPSGSLDIDWHASILVPVESRARKLPFHFTGVLAGRRFVGVRKEDDVLRDEVGRPVGHMALWFLPEAVPAEQVPGDWFEQFYETVRPTYLDLYDLPEEEVRAWWQKGQPLGRFLRAELTRVADTVEIKPGAPPDAVVDLGDRTDPRLAPGSSQTGRLRSQRRVPRVFVVLACVAVLAWAVAWLVRR